MPVSTRPRVTRLKDVKKPKAEPPIALSADGAVPIDEDRTFQVTKGSAIAATVAAPGAKNIGRELTFITGTDFAHVFTFTGTTLEDGTTGLNTTWTSAAFAGSSLTVVARTATRWSVKSFNLGTIAP